MNIREQAEELLKEFSLCYQARPKHGIVDVQIDKDNCDVWARYLQNTLNWGSELEVTEAYYQLEPRLYKLKEKIILEVLKHGV